MRIKSLSFRNVGPFGEAGIRLEGFTPGLNVVCETNEFGKSTVLKALETMLFKPFSSSDKQVKALRTAAAADNAPEGEILFSSDGRDYRLHKQFLKQKGARLQDAQTGEILAVDRSAEEALAKLLRADRYVGGPSGLLWVRQGTSMEGIADDGQIASRLEGELGTLIGGARGREYLARAETELANILTRGGQEKKNGPLRNAREAAEATQAELVEAKRQRDQTTAIGIELTKVTAEIARLTQEASDTKLPEQIKETQAAMMTAKSFAKELELVEAQHIQAQLAAERAAERQANYIASLVRFNDTTKQLADMTSAHQQYQTDQQTAQAERGVLCETIAADETRLDAAMQLQAHRETHGRQIQRLDSLQNEQQQMNARLEHINALDAELAKQTQAMSDFPVISRTDVETLRVAANELRQYEAELAALSTRLYLELSPKGCEKVTLDGKVLKSGPVNLPGGSSLSIEGIGELRSDDEKLSDTARYRDRADADYKALLIRFGVEDITEASKTADTRQEIERERKRLAADISRLAPEGVAALQTQASTVEIETRELAEALEESSGDLKEIDHNDILEGLRTQRAKLGVIDETLAAVRKAVAQSDTKQAQLLERLTGLSLAKDEVTRTAEADKLAREKFKADSDMRARLTDVEAIKARAPDQPLEMLTARLTRLEQVSQHARDRLEQLKTTEAGLRARRDAAFEGGDADGVVDALVARHKTQMAALAEQERAKDVRLLLRDTLIETQTRLREAYTAPVTQELAPLLSRVIPGAEAGLSEHLGVDTVQRNGKVEALAQLSGGTQEQFAILTRLAYARLLAKSGASAPVILDDALVYADDARRDAMFDVLGLVSSSEHPIQIIYLSCHAGATANLGGTRISPKPWT